MTGTRRALRTKVSPVAWKHRQHAARVCFGPAEASTGTLQAGRLVPDEVHGLGILAHEEGAPFQCAEHVPHQPLGEWAANTQDKRGAGRLEEVAAPAVRVLDTDHVQDLGYLTET